MNNALSPVAPRASGRAGFRRTILAGFAAFSLTPQPFAGVVHETTSAYHHILVVDQRGRRTLSFDGSEETRMSLANPLQGHFEYVEYFFTPWLWNTNISNVLMLGLGGGSIQRLYAAHCPTVTIDTVEVDAAVQRVAGQYFNFNTGPRQRVFVQDGRMFLRRSNARYDLILLDAYTRGRYGSAIPHHLATREFFTLAREHLTADGVLAYNVIGTLNGYRADIVGSVYRTMKTVFPEVHLFPATESLNIVLVGTVRPVQVTPAWLKERTETVVNRGLVKLPTFAQRVSAFRAMPPANVERCPLLTDDFAPVDGLLGNTR